MTTFNQGYISAYPPGLEREVLHVLAMRQGREKAISRSMLLDCVTRGAFSKTTDRQLRAAINGLRKAGKLIGSTGGIDGGYFMLSTWEEANDYLQQEVYARISDLSDQAQAMRRAAMERWGEEVTSQPRML